ncbi:hypothetical protein D3C72_1464930 [compost metagenome]
MDAHAMQRLRGPAQEAVALGIAAGFGFQVARHGVGAGVVLDRQRVVHRRIHRQHRIEQARVAAGLGHGIAHRGHIDQRGGAGGVVHQHTARLVGDLGFAGAVLQPRQDAGDGVVALGAFGIADHILQQQAEDDGQAPELVAGDGRQVDDAVSGVTDAQ